MTISTSNPSVSAVSPDSVSPVLRQELTLSLADYTDTMAVDDFSVTLVSNADNTVTRELNVLSVDDGAKTLNVLFPGAGSGTYSFRVNGANGALQSKDVQLTTKLSLTGISPSSGSNLGGTLLTLTGEHFGNVATDNPVTVNGHDCLVQTTSEFEVTCRIEPLSG